MSIIFRDGSKANDDHSDLYLLIVNRDRGIIVDPLERLDEEERVAVVTDIINSKSINNDVTVNDPEWTPATNMFGKPKSNKVNGMKTH